MIALRMQLFCDGPRSGESHHERYFPSDGPINATMFTQTELRLAAELAGWRRTKGKDRRDICPDCALTIERREEQP